MQTTREYFYRIDRAGRLTHDGTELTDAKFLDFFYKRIKANDTGAHADYPFVSPCGNEMNYIRCEDTPIVFTRLRADGEDREYGLFYAPGLAVEFQPRQLRFSENGVLYHAAPVGEFGRLNSELTLEIGRRVEPWGPYYAYRHGSDHDAGDRNANERGDEAGARTGRETVIEPLTRPANIDVLHSRPENECYGCGGANPAGFGLTFLFDSEQKTAHSWLTPGAYLQGGPGRMHGGFIALLLDEVMAKVLTGMGLSGDCPTARMEVNFRRPIVLEERIELFARLESQQGRKYRLHGEIRNSDGSLLAEAEALYVKVMDGESPPPAKS